MKENLARLWGLPFSTYAPRRRGGVKTTIYFHCVLHTKRGEGEITCKIAYEGQFFSECTIGNVRHIGIHVYSYVPIVLSGKN